MNSSTSPLWFKLQQVASCVAAGALLTVAATSQAQTDNFNSGTLGPNWATSISANFPGTISFPSDPFGGKAIRLVATNCTLTPPPYPQDESAYTARVLAWRTDRLYTNFYVAVDILGWDTSIESDTNAPLIGLMARAVNVVRDPSVPVGWPDCMILFLNYNRFGGTGGGTRGVIDMGHLKDGGTASVFNTLGVQAECTLKPGHSYRMVFTGTNMLDYLGNPSSVYWGRVYDLQDLTHPLVAITCPDPYPGFDPTAPWETPGYSGIASVADGIHRSDDHTFINYTTTDVTFDNFVAAEYPPASVSFPGTTNGEAGLPQVINRTPASYSNFYAPAGGISFTATTLGGGNVTSVKLFLNGLDVSSGLTISPLSNSRTVTFPGSGLTSNRVYDARIELANAASQKTTNIWTFDTFSDAYLASTNLCKIIECEEFDFNGGQFIDNPVPSGWPTNVTFYNDANTVPYPWAGATNQDGASPPYTSYVNKGTTNDLGVDYWDVEGHNYQKTWYEADFRPLYLPNDPPTDESAGHSPGTTQGAFYSVVDYLGWWFPGNIGQNEKRVFDTQRQKYVNVSTNIQEYLLERLEGGEWYNYTRTFASSNYYNVYLRHGSEYNVQLSLSQIGPGPTTNKLGEFYTTAAMVTWNYCYTPLMTLVTPPNSLIVNGTFAANASSFSAAPGYTGGSNPSSITGWTELNGSNGTGLNGPGTSVGNPFAPGNPGGLTYAFVQGGNASVGHALRQYLTTLAPSTTYQLVYSVAGRANNIASYRVVVYSDNSLTTSYYDSGVQAANSSGFVTVTASFTTPATLGSAPNIHLGNWSVAGDNTVDYANVFLVAASSPPTLSQPAVLNFSGPTKLRLLMDFPQEERSKYGLMLNYMAFVPAFVVLSSSQPDTGYTLDSAASIDQTTKTITIPQSGPARFYRLSWDRQLTITSITQVGSSIVLTYQ
jgi:hypothetical protein